MTTLAPATPPMSPGSLKSGGPALFARLHRSISPSYHTASSQVVTAHTPPSSAGGAKNPVSISPKANRGARNGITVFPSLDRLPPGDAAYQQKADANSPTGKPSLAISSHPSPQRQTSKSKPRRGIWPRRHQDQPPPVPELPHYLNVNLPFESAVDLQVDRSHDELQTIYHSTHVGSTPTKLEEAISLRSTGTDPTMTPAAAVAQRVTQQYAAEAQKLRESGLARARALAEARLTPSQVVEIVKLTGSEIKQRGLANVGILRPFRVGTSLANVSRLAELFLLSSEPQKYDGVLSLSPPPTAQSVHLGPNGSSSEIAIATLGRPSAHKELVRQLAYANVHDVSDFLKWSLRRLEVDKADFASQSALSWYTDFVEREKESGYELTSFSDDLLSHLPEKTTDLLTALFDLLTTVSAHFVANAMPASRICRMLGFWLFGRIADEKCPTDFESFLADWKRSTGIMEHLLLAYLRDQSAKVHSMPTRLTELIRIYPSSLEEHFGAPAMPNGVGAADAHNTGRALKVHLESSGLRPNLLRYRGPKELLHCALNARLSDGESSAEADDWTSLLRLARGLETTNRRDKGEEDIVVGSDLEMGHDASSDLVSQLTSGKTSKLAALLPEEDLRIFEIYAEELAMRRTLFGVSKQDEAQLEGQSSMSTQKPAGQINVSPLIPLSPISGGSKHPGMTASQSYPMSPFIQRKPRLSILPEDKSASSRKSSGAKPLSSDGYQAVLPNHGKSSLASSPPPPQAEEKKSVDWTAFREDGFDAASSTDLSLGDAELHRSLTIGDLRRDQAALTSPSRSPGTALRRLRGHASVGNLRRRAQRRASTDYAQFAAGIASNPKREPSYTVTSVSTIELDEGLVSMWQDAVLDPSAANSLPSIAFVALNSTASNSLMSPAGLLAGTRGRSAAAASSAWLMIEETVTSTQTVAPSGLNNNNGGRLGRRRSSSHGARDADASSLDGRRSLFAPSLRSMGASVFRRRGSLKKMSSFGALKRRTDATQHAPHDRNGSNRAAKTAPPPPPPPPLPTTSGTSEGYVLVPASASMNPSSSVEGAVPEKGRTPERNVGRVSSSATTKQSHSPVMAEIDGAARGRDHLARRSPPSPTSTLAAAAAAADAGAAGEPSLRAPPTSVPVRRSSMKRSKSSAGASATGTASTATTASGRSGM